MMNESDVLKRMGERFPAADRDAATTSLRRVYLPMPVALLQEALCYAKEEMGFGHLCAITGLDTEPGLEFMYHIANEAGIVLSLKFCAAGREGITIPSVLPIYAGATFYERELEGLLGVKVEGLPAGRQYPLPDNWPQGEYPMRKDWVPGADRHQA